MCDRLIGVPIDMHNRPVVSVASRNMIAGRFPARSSHKTDSPSGPVFRKKTRCYKLCQIVNCSLVTLANCWIVKHNFRKESRRVLSDSAKPPRPGKSVALSIFILCRFLKISVCTLLSPAMLIRTKLCLDSRAYAGAVRLSSSATEMSLANNMLPLCAWKSS